MLVASIFSFLHNVFHFINEKLHQLHHKFVIGKFIYDFILDDAKFCCLLKNYNIFSSLRLESRFLPLPFQTQIQTFNSLLHRYLF